MPHKEVHTIKGLQYQYEVTNYRVGTKVKHRWKYLGPLKPIYKTKKR